MVVDFKKQDLANRPPNKAENANQRKRKWHHKVRSGCLLCRQRHVKCDERKPACHRCSSTGRWCPGYEPSKAWIFESSVERCRKEYRRQQNLVLIHPPSVSPFVHDEGFRSFQYYFEVAEPALSSFFSSQMAAMFDDSQSRDEAIATTEVFWKIEFPRLVCAVPAIQSCLLLLTAAHEHIRNAVYAVHHFHQDPNNLNKYGTAVSHLRREYSCLSTDCILLGTLMLAIGELCHGPSNVGLRHLYSASQIIEQRQIKPSTFDEHDRKEEIDGLKNAVGLMFRAFFRNMSQESMVPSSTLKYALDGADTPKVSIDLPFSTLQQVIRSLSEIKRTALERIRTGHPKDDETGIALQLKADSWLRSLNRFMNRPRNAQAWGFTKACLFIRIHGYMTLILSRLSRTSSELDCDDQTLLFGEMTETAEELYERTSGQLSDCIRDNLVPCNGLVNPLFFAATKCRSYAIRQRLLGVLKLLKMAEGPWTSCTAYQIAVHLSNIEEEWIQNLPNSSPRGIPWHKRPRLVSAHLDDIFTVTIEYALCGFVGEGCEETYSKSFSLQPCEHQATLLAIESFSIGEYGASEGNVRESSCTCVKKGTELQKDFEHIT